MPEVVDSIVNNIGIDMFDEEIDDVIFQTNEFLTDATFIGASGPFWWLSDITSFGTSKPSVNQLLGSFFSRDMCSRRDKNGTKSKEIISNYLSGSSIISNIAIAGAKLQNCSDINEGIQKKLLFILPFPVISYISSNFIELLITERKFSKDDYVQKMLFLCTID
jgi:hypothetical protein